MTIHYTTRRHTTTIQHATTQHNTTTRQRNMSPCNNTTTGHTSRTRINAAHRIVSQLSPRFPYTLALKRVHLFCSPLCTPSLAVRTLPHLFPTPRWLVCCRALVELLVVSCVRGCCCVACVLAASCVRGCCRAACAVSVVVCARGRCCADCAFGVLVWGR